MFLGSIFCCINYDTQCVELYQGSKKLGSYASSFSKTSNADLRSDPSLYTVEMRIRAEYVEWLGQKENPDGKGWAAGAGYGAKIITILNVILSRLVDTFSSRILYPMLLLSGNHSIAVV